VVGSTAGSPVAVSYRRCQALKSVEEVQPARVVAEQFESHQEPRGEDAVVVVVGDDVVVRGDPGLGHQRREVGRVGEHALSPAPRGRVALTRGRDVARSAAGRGVLRGAEAVERDGDRPRQVADAIVLPGLAHVHEPDAVPVRRDPRRRHDRFAHPSRVRCPPV